MATKPERGSERVKAWIYAVINPWAEILMFEHQLLAAGSVSFRWRSGKFEYVSPLRQSLARGAELILDDLGRIHPEVKAWESEHDEAIDRLRHAAIEAFADITVRAELRTAVLNAKASSPELARGVTGGDEQLIALMSERVLNNVGTLSSDYSDADFWKQHRSEFIAFRSGTKFDVLDHHRTELAQMNEATTRRLASLRDQLVDEYDVPPAVMG